jgi:hypothetical protein
MKLAQECSPPNSAGAGLRLEGAVMALWTPAAQANFETCEDHLQSCLYSANQDPDMRVREIYSEWCYADYQTCESSGTCGDYYCQSMELYENSCPADCGPGFTSNGLGTAEGICSSSAPSASVSRG